ncbi:hypothetical protein BS329_20865 [Amycolatopsis coloradensis]|uniref:Pentapeptide repeat-containing protein n=1 Tax=Amycolatopsis coloradensis TaxID=76021 RepID=A0A1R0KR13_9PSEU|nr:pentapeptide repeat-containing protein [Amycolatopsis coloradensis]OLZ50076.1 hypothetical protein BS329_20865 [Amycolatopsis coloradensis]
MKSRRKGPSLREFAWVWVWVTLAVSVAVGITITVLLWGDTPANHRDAFDIGWKSSAAVLAILAAFVTVERLRLSQREHHRQLHNDEATHINTLSSQASEQLGSDKAAVRIGGLTDLERLAEQYPTLRQTVVDRICAYLRAPYQPPSNLSALGVDARLFSVSATTDQAKQSVSAGADDEIAARRLELDVRRTAQQILHRHLRRESGAEGSSDAFWEKISVDLRDAVLVEVDFTNFQVASADFRNMIIYGVALFSWATFEEDVSFDGATFDGAAEFTGAKFQGSATFRNVTFCGDASFGGAQFGGFSTFADVTFDRSAAFTKATFGWPAEFTKATFDGPAHFASATFAEDALFTEATFDRSATFSEVQFHGDAFFGRAQFRGDASFNEAEFDVSAAFQRAMFGGPAAFTRATFGGDAWFRRATFNESARFSVARFARFAEFVEVTFEKDVSFKEAKFNGDALLGETTYKAEIALDGARVDNVKHKHAWPAGWHAEAFPHQSGTTGRLVPVAPSRDDGPREHTGDESEADV